MGVETEIKLATTPEMLARLLADPRLCAADGTEIREHLISTYFDTDDSRLHTAGAALRIREKARDDATPHRREQTLKLIAPNQAALHRQEWNIPIPAITSTPAPTPNAPTDIIHTPDPLLWPPVPRKALAALVGGADVHRLGATHVTRLRRRIRHGTALIDIMADCGEIIAHSPTPAPSADPSHTPTRQPICELELELVEGTLADTLSLAACLPLGPDLIWLVAGKGARCRALALGEPLRPVGAPKVKLTRTMDVATGFATIGWSCLNHLLANYPLALGVYDSDGLSTGHSDPEAIHQSRVALRRLRAGFSLFGHAVTDAQSPALREGLKAAAAAMAPARDAHVLLQRITAALSPTHGAETATSALLAQLADARDTAARAAQAHLAAAPFQRLLVDLALWLEAGDWRKAAKAPLATTAQAIFGRRQRKLRRHARTTDLADDAQLHTLRIEVKKLRYAIDFMVTTLPSARARAHARAQAHLLGRLQDALGDLHDIAMAQIARLEPDCGQTPTSPGLSPADTAALARALAAHTESLVTHTPRLLRKAEKLIAQNADGPKWWSE